VNRSAHWRLTWCASGGGVLRVHRIHIKAEMNRAVSSVKRKDCNVIIKNSLQRFLNYSKLCTLCCLIRFSKRRTKSHISWLLKLTVILDLCYKTIEVKTETGYRLVIVSHKAKRPNRESGTCRYWYTYVFDCLILRWSVALKKDSCKLFTWLLSFGDTKFNITAKKIIYKHFDHLHDRCWRQ
jgi:hypothetical protein